MIVDHDETYLTFIREHGEVRRAERGWRKINKVVEIGYSAKSHANTMIQISDLVAFSMKKYFESMTLFSDDWCDDAKEFFRTCRNIIWNKVKYKRLSFSKLNVPSLYINYMKDISL